MKPEIREIFNKHGVLDFEIYDPIPDRPFIFLLKTPIKDEGLILELEQYLNRQAIAFGLEGPFKIEWKELKI